MEDHQPLTHDPLITTSTTPYQPPTSITTNTPSRDTRTRDAGTRERYRGCGMVGGFGKLAFLFSWIEG